MRWPLAIALSACLGLSACGSDSGISAAASADLGDRIDRIERAVEDGDTEGAASKLLALEEAVARWLDRGELNEARAARILATATAASARLQAIAAANPEPTPTVTIAITETATATVTETETEFDHHGRGKDHKDEDED